MLLQRSREDQFNAGLQCQLPTNSALLYLQYIYQGIARFIDSGAARARLLLQVARPHHVQAPVERLPPHQPMLYRLMAPAETPKHASKRRLKQ